MDNLRSIDEIQTLFHQIRSKKKGFVTNFFLNSFRHSLWIEHGELYYENYDDCFLLIKRNKEYSYLYFISTDFVATQKALNIFLQKNTETYVVDLVGNDSILVLKDALLSLGFQEYEILYRMSRTGQPVISLPIDENIEKGTHNDAEKIKELLDKYFDSFSEQLPSIEELLHLLEDGTVLVYKEYGCICGFIIYELIGVTLYLRYWFVVPDFREKSVGSKLFNAFMNAGVSSKRQLFWVISRNENAIKRYLHYGFSPEKLYDYVLIKK